MKTLTLMERLAAYFAETETPFVCAYLFGSEARGEGRPGSDVDVAVLFPAGSSTGLVGSATSIRGDLERLLRRTVDLVDMRRASVDLIHRILRDGHLLADRDPLERIRFEVQARNEYFDLLPYLRMYRRYGAAS
jgi:hypothetical protein